MKFLIPFFYGLKIVIRPVSIFIVAAYAFNNNLFTHQPGILFHQP